MANSSGRNNEISSSPYFNGGGAGVGSQFQPLATQPERPLGLSVGSMYAAFGNYEREVRQRKYMIAECEDTFGGWKSALDEREKQQKELVIEGEKLLVENNAVEAIYEKCQKEKQLIENQYEKLASEMDCLSEQAIMKQTMIKKIEMMTREKVEFAKAKTQEHKIAYLKVPAIAHLNELKEQHQDVKGQLEESRGNFQKHRQELDAVLLQTAQDWEVFKAICVKSAETRSELQKKIQLQAELDATAKKMNNPPAPAPLAARNTNYSSQTTQSATQKSLYQREPLKKISSVAVPVPRSNRPSSFQLMDRILMQSDTWKKYAKPNAWSATATPASSRETLMPPPPTPTTPGRSGSNLVSELRSRIKSPVRIHPMPRYMESQFGGTSTTSSQESTESEPIPDSQISSENVTFDMPERSYESVVNQPVQMDVTVSTPTHNHALLPPSNQIGGPVLGLESMDTNEESIVEKTLPLPNERGRGASNSTPDTNATRAAQASTNNGGTPGSFSSLFSLENESASTSSGFFDNMDFFGNSSAPTDKNDFFGSASTTNSNPGSVSNPNDGFNFFFG